MTQDFAGPQADTTNSTSSVTGLLRAAEQELRSNPVQAGVLAGQAAQLALRLGDRAALAAAQVLAGYGRVFEGKFSSGQPLLLEGLLLARETGLVSLQARALNGLGLIASNSGQCGMALEHYTQALHLARQTGEAGNIARTLSNIGNMFVQLRDFEEARRYHGEALDEAEQAGSLLAIMIRVNLAFDDLQLGQLDAALEQNLKLREDTSGEKFVVERAHLLANLACTLTRLGQSEEAWQVTLEGLALAKELGVQSVQCELMLTQGELHVQAGRRDEAREAFVAALALARSMPVVEWQSEAHRQLAALLRGDEDFQGALEHAWAHHELETATLRNLSERRNQILTVQFQVELLRQRAREQEQQNAVLTNINNQLRETQKRLAFEASHDSLTGLLTRAALEEALADELLIDPAPTRALLMVDVDHFKQINDALGHHVGDVFLQELSRRLCQCLRPGDDVARQGGDEFTVYMRNVPSEEEVMVFAHELLRHISAPVVVEGRPLIVTASAGVAVYPGDGQDVLTLEKHADLALYRAKQERHRVRRFEKAMSFAAIERLETEQALRQALENGDLDVHYQPIVDAHTGHPVGVEALLRWQPQGQPPMSPERFVSIAEESDLIVQVGSWGVQRALDDLNAMRAVAPHLFVSLNVSPRQFSQSRFGTQLEHELRARHLPKSALMLELTEGTLLENTALEQYEALEGQGFQLALDDVGSGYSNLAQLYRVPAHMLKVDATLIHQLAVPRGPSARAMVHSLITFAHDSGLRVVAEGVETPEQLGILRDLNCHFVQGYLEARPMPLTELLTYLAQRPGSVSPLSSPTTSAD